MRPRDDDGVYGLAGLPCFRVVHELPGQNELQLH